MCHKSKTELKREDAFVLDYIKWGEKMGFHKRPTCRSRKRWWDLGKRKISDFIVSSKVGERFALWINKKYLADKILYEVYLKKADPKYQFFTVINSLVFRLFIEVSSRQLTGAQAISDIDVCVYTSVLIINPTFLPASTININMEVCSLFTELGFNKNKPIREQEPNPLPDRKALDDIVFDAIGLTEEERKEVYWSVAELVKSRLDKARSFKK
ncbi:hypothetical protein J7K25_04475 [bacterium]|nr:hypothetical protein [bacterium]